MNGGTSWPPPGEPVAGARELPEPATAVYRLGIARMGFVSLLPTLLLLSCGRLLANTVPPSRLFNPGVLALLALSTVAVVASFVPARRRVMVAGGSGWMARRVVPWSRFRVVRLADVSTYSARVIATRGGRRTVLVLVDRDGEHTSVSVPVTSPCGTALAEALQAYGARQVPPRETRGGGTWRQTAAVVAVLLAVAAVPIGYLLVGPLRLLPPGAAGWFSSSGCRAAFAAERTTAAPAPPLVWQAEVDVAGMPWRLHGDYRMTLDAFAASSADPAARRAHLLADGAQSADQLEYDGPGGQVLAVDEVMFATADGAMSYDRYVNRATCERFEGSSGPAPTEVRWHSGHTYGMVRWVTGHTLYDVSPALTTPRATGRDADGLAAAFLAGATPSRTAAAP